MKPLDFSLVVGESIQDFSFWRVGAVPRDFIFQGYLGVVPCQGERFCSVMESALEMSPMAMLLNYVFCVAIYKGSAKKEPSELREYCQ